MRELIKEKGFRGFQTGNQRKIIKFVPRQCFNFAFNNYYNKRILTRSTLKEYSDLLIIKNMLSGGLAGITTYLLYYPFVNFNKYVFRLNYYSRKNIYNFYKKKNHILLYQKIHFELITILPYNSIYFGFFKTGINNLKESKKNIIQKFIFANIVTLLAEIINFPFFIMKKKIKEQTGFFFKRIFFKDLIKFYFSIEKGKRIDYFYKGFGGFGRAISVVRGGMLLTLFDDLEKFGVNK